MLFRSNGISIAEEADGILIRAQLGTSDAIAGESLELLIGNTPFGTPLTKTLDSTDISNDYVDFTIPTGELASGSNSITSKVTDVAGNTSSASGTLTLTFDGAAPTVTGTPVDQNSENTNGISIAEEADGILIRAELGTSDAIAGESLELLIGNTPFGTPLTKTLDSTDISNDYVDFTIPTGELASGSNSITSKVTDVAGNTSSASGTLTLTFDDAAPTFSVTSVSPVSGNTAKVGENVVVTLTAGGLETGLTASGTQTVNTVTSVFAESGSGVYTITYTIVEGNTDISDASALPVSITLKDPAGNIGTTITTIVEIGRAHV